MDIAIVTAGSRGDVDPYLALGLGLRAAGHRVLLATTPEHRQRAAERGLETFAFREGLSALSETPEGREARDPGVPLPSWLPRLRRALRRGEEYLRGVMADCAGACEGADAVVASPFGFAVPHVAEALGIPWAWGLLQPLTATRAFPFFLAPPGLPALGAVNRASYRIAARIAWRLVGGLIRDWRRRAGLPPASLRGLLALQGAAPALYAFSPALVPRPGDWPDHHLVTGYWLLDANAPWTPPAGLERFLATGPCPFYIGLGGIAAEERGRVAILVREALARTGRRALVLAPWSEDEPPWPDGVHRLDAAPHHSLLPRMAGAIHHGGAGTTGACLRAGIPALALPGGFDQYFWGRRLAAAGAGPPPVPARSLSLQALLRGLEALDEEPLRRRAAELGERVRCEDGVAAAVAALERRWGRLC